MSFVPQPQRQNASSQNAVTPSTGAAAQPASDENAIFKIRTFDLFFVDRNALMYRDGYAKVSLGNDDDVALSQRVLTRPCLGF